MTFCRVQTGAAWPSSARVLRCSINFCNGRNPYSNFIRLVSSNC